MFCLVSCEKKHLYLFSAGSYPYVEVYKINKTEQETINLVNKLKEQNPELIVPITTWAGDLHKYEDNKNSHWYFVYIYVKEENRAIRFYIRGDRKPTSIALIASTYRNSLTNWKLINKDFDDDENEHIIKWFEENILKELEKEGAEIKRETFWGTEAL